MNLFRFEEPELEPKRATKYSAGYDLRSKEEHILYSKQSVIVKTGVFLDMPKDGWFDIRKGHYFGLHIRSSMANKGLRLMNGVGVIDMDYEKEIGVMIENTGLVPIKISKHDRIAQLVLNTCLMLGEPDAEREGGFGSTGE